MTVSVEYTRVTHAAEVVRRQAGHTRAMGQYIDTEGSLSGDLGLILVALAPIAGSIQALGAQVCRFAADAADIVAGAVDSSLESYVETDRATHERFSRLMARLDVDVPPFQDPTEGIGELGPPEGGAPEGHGHLAGNPWERGEQIAENAMEAGDGFSDLREEAGGWGGEAADVAEKSDPSSFLVTPTVGEDFVSDMRWGAGLLIGGVDWVVEKIAGVSFLEEVIYKPFAGDWKQIKSASGAWEFTGDAYTAVAQNLAGLVPSTSEAWEGVAGTAFRTTVGLGSRGAVAASGACGSIAGLYSLLVTVCKLVCKLLNKLLKQLNDWLLKLAAKLAVPVAGWIAAGVDLVFQAQEIWKSIRLGWKIGNFLLDVIDKFPKALNDLSDTLGIWEDLAEGAYRGATA